MKENVLETTLRLKNLDMSKLGVYSCRAENKLGSDEKEFVVIKSQPIGCNLGHCESFASSKSSNLALSSFIMATITTFNLVNQHLLLFPTS